ncbi:MAG TPA: hypothetical protein VFO66_02120 [Gemmatimonadaceae bacterium]|nr:hypothetical protein [Gemmatimonadaceae bacterium]
MRIAIAVTLLAAIVAVVAKLALSPYHHVHTAEECRAAYAAARTRMDSVAASFKPFDDGNRSVDMRCSSVLAVGQLSSAEELLGR